MTKGKTGVKTGAVVIEGEGCRAATEAFRDSGTFTLGAVQ